MGCSIRLRIAAMTKSGMAKSMSATHSGIMSLLPNLFHLVLFVDVRSMVLLKLYIAIEFVRNYNVVDSIRKTSSFDVAIELFEIEDAMSQEVEATIREQIETNPILLYMKGSPQQPQCGFSAQTVQCLMQCGQRFAYIDILSNPDIRATLPRVANWPTFPQLWVGGELIGGCDIVTEMFEAGELETIVREASESVEESSAEE